VWRVVRKALGADKLAQFLGFPDKSPLFGPITFPYLQSPFKASNTSVITLRLNGTYHLQTTLQLRYHVTGVVVMMHHALR
jgi:hypothetical protein